MIQVSRLLAGHTVQLTGARQAPDRYKNFPSWTPDQEAVLRYRAPPNSRYHPCPRPDGALIAIEEVFLAGIAGGSLIN